MENHKPRLILASSSPYRASLLQQLQLDFECISSDIDESPKAEESSHDTALRLAREKARHIARQQPDSLVIGSDQVASLEGSPLGKPLTHDKARQQLTQCSGKTVRFYTGLSVINSQTGTEHSLCEHFDVQFRQLSPQQIENYLQREKPYDCAGAFKVEGLGITLFESLSGKDPNSLIGLPLISLTTLLYKEGIDVLTQAPN